MCRTDSEQLPWFVYILRCADGSLYTGATIDVEARLRAHAAGRGARYTRSRLPVALVHIETACSKREALQREAEIKSWDRGEKLALLQEVSQ